MKHEWRDGTRTRITSDASKTELNRVPYALTRHCENCVNVLLYAV